MDDTDHNTDDQLLDGLFEAARATPEPASAALMQRVLADASALRDAQEAAELADAASTAGPARKGLLAGMFSALGGWPAAAGLATATVAGIWIGFSPALGVGEAMVSAVGIETTTATLFDYGTGFDFAFEEGDAG